MKTQQTWNFWEVPYELHIPYEEYMKQPDLYPLYPFKHKGKEMNDVQKTDGLVLTKEQEDQFIADAKAKAEAAQQANSNQGVASKEKHNSPL